MSGVPRAPTAVNGTQRRMWRGTPNRQAAGGAAGAATCRPATHAGICTAAARHTDLRLIGKRVLARTNAHSRRIGQAHRATHRACRAGRASRRDRSACWPTSSTSAATPFAVQVGADGFAPLRGDHRAPLGYADRRERSRVRRGDRAERIAAQYSYAYDAIRNGSAANGVNRGMNGRYWPTNGGRVKTILQWRHSGYER